MLFLANDAPNPAHEGHKNSPFIRIRTTNHIGCSSQFLLMIDSVLLQALNEKLMYLYKPFPPFHLGRGLVSLSALDLESTVSGRPSNPYTWDVLGRPLTWMAAEAFGYLLLTLLIENDIPLWLWRSMQTYISSSSAITSAVFAPLAPG